MFTSVFFMLKIYVQIYGMIMNTERTATLEKSAMKYLIVIDITLIDLFCKNNATM